MGSIPRGCVLRVGRVVTNRYSSGKNRHTARITRLFWRRPASLPDSSTIVVAPCALSETPIWGSSLQLVGGGSIQSLPIIIRMVAAALLARARLASRSSRRQV